LPSSLYTDRGSHYFLTPKAGEPVDKARLTQVGRALLQLGIEHIPAYSPAARGRSERTFGTLQGRLPKELRLWGLTEIEEANRYIRDIYLPTHNQRFARPAQIPQESGFVPVRDPASLVMFCASSRAGWWHATTRSLTKVVRCNSRKVRRARITLKRMFACMNIPMAPWRYSMGRGGWRATLAKARRSSMPRPAPR
jgi:hypothetical protein